MGNLGPSTRTITAVMLSDRPGRLAKSTSAWTASAGGRQPRAMPISSSSLARQPSLHNRKVSPAWTGWGPSRSTCTAGLGPSDRVMMFFEI